MRPVKEKQSESGKASGIFFKDSIGEQKAGGTDPGELAAEGSGPIRGLMKRFHESALQGEMDERPGYAKGSPRAVEPGNLRKGKGSKKAITGHGSLQIDTPRGRDGGFEPQVIAKHRGFCARLQWQGSLPLRAGNEPARHPGPAWGDLADREAGQELVSPVAGLHGDGGVGKRAVYAAPGGQS